MLLAMALVDRYRSLVSELPEGWQEAQLALTVADEGERRTAAAILGPTGPGLSGETIRFAVSRSGLATGEDNLGRLLARIDAEGVDGSLELVGGAVLSIPPAVAAGAPSRSLAAGWDAAVATLPRDWSDVYAELQLVSSDHIDPAALLAGPLNPHAERDRPVMRFRVAQTAGYGASPGMVRRCLERLDDAGIPGSVRIVHALSDSAGGFTQGPSWIVAGRSV
jgi:hypothetical protein